MSITTIFAQGKLRLSGMLNSISVAGLQHLYKGLFPMTRETTITVASSHSLQSQQCPECKTQLGAANEMYSRIAVCDHCGYHFVWSAFNRVEHLADPGSFRPLGRYIQPMDFLDFDDEHPYARKLISTIPLKTDPLAWRQEPKGFFSIPPVLATKVLTNRSIEAYAELSIDNVHSVKGYMIIHWLSSTPSNEAGES